MHPNLAFLDTRFWFILILLMR